MGKPYKTQTRVVLFPLLTRPPTSSSKHSFTTHGTPKRGPSSLTAATFNGSECETTHTKLCPFSHLCQLGQAARRTRQPLAVPRRNESAPLRSAYPHANRDREQRCRDRTEGDTDRGLSVSMLRMKRSTSRDDVTWRTNGDANTRVDAHSVSWSALVYLF